MVASARQQMAEYLAINIGKGETMDIALRKVERVVEEAIEQHENTMISEENERLRETLQDLAQAYHLRACELDGPNPNAFVDCAEARCVAARELRRTN